ncbi:hypothetical protein KI387_014338 [Taxus chinensis]|uniref:Alpha/beta hydrolase fold-3 domain-containing protein n=1 Tax=Taxus chinensis TaxID=29808 RepID=A0AA38FHU0_TAXCH|nr:hypothetical protein KI387_014338 [Taxus chinensis]
MGDNCECGTEQPRVVADLCGLIKVYSDGSIVRAGEPYLPPPKSEENNDKLGPYKDVVYNAELGLWARIYLPPPPHKKTRLPVLLFFHASGFCSLSPATPVVHSMCLLWAARLGVIIVSVKYRLAPENRLPAAYEDSIAALQWVLAMKTEAGGGAVAVDPWLHSHADLSNIFVAGESAGGNVAHHLGCWVAAQDAKNAGADRTPSEARDPGLMEQADIMWRYALPVGSNRDHPFCNPVGEGRESAVSTLALPPMLFVIAGLDALLDRLLQYCELLKKCGKQVEVAMFDEDDHGFTLFNAESDNSLEAIRRFSDFIWNKS